MTVTNSATGCTSSDQVTANFYRTGNSATIEEQVLDICTGDRKLIAKITSGCTTGNTFRWFPENQTSQEIIIPEPTSPIIYSVIVSNGCFSTTSQITVFPGKKLKNITLRKENLIYPSAFTPYDSPGLNDVFIIYELGLSAGAVPAYDAKAYNLKIFDRWGGIIYNFDGNSSSGFYNGEIQWNGYANKNITPTFLERLLGRKRITAGQLVPQGVYIWRLELTNCLRTYTVIQDEAITTTRSGAIIINDSNENIRPVIDTVNKINTENHDNYYPSPSVAVKKTSEGHFQVSTHSEFEEIKITSIYVFDVFGKVLIKIENINNSIYQQLDISRYPVGLYIFRIINSKGKIITIKIANNR